VKPPSIAMQSVDEVDSPVLSVKSLPIRTSQRYEMIWNSRILRCTPLHCDQGSVMWRVWGLSSAICGMSRWALFAGCTVSPYIILRNTV